MPYPKKEHLIAGLGEVLWDVFPDAEKLGGAPANFAAHVQQLGAKTYLLTALGNDLMGQKAIALIKDLKVNISGIQLNEDFPTGRVIVSIDSMGNPSYEIEENAAWDHIEFDSTKQNIAKRLDALCFGTLAQRNSISKNTILKILKSTAPGCLRVFDVNFRKDFYNPEMVEQSLGLASAVKMNEVEFSVIASMLSLSQNHKYGLQSLIRKFDLKFGIITLGEKGAVMASKDHFCFYSTKNTIKIKSTVGAGDAFVASAVMGWLDKKPLEQINKEASDLATYVCSHLEAVPEK